jgi:signal transduction histidine kinase
MLSQQTLQRNIDEVYLLIENGDSVIIISEGEQIYDLYIREVVPQSSISQAFSRKALEYYSENKQALLLDEQIISSLEGDETFHLLVPFYDHGEVSGAAYMRVTPDVGRLLAILKTAYGQSSILFTALILMGFMAMFFIYSYAAREREQVQHQLFDERAIQLREQIEHQKELLFTKRIYHTHHKAEKVMGFIKEDLRSLMVDNLGETRDRVTKYANFVSRAIYDMKSYDPPLHVIRNPIFQSNINEVITFVVKNIFQRVYRKGETNAVDINLALADDLPIIHVNEYVIWEVIEPLIQNAIDHNSDRSLELHISTQLDSAQNELIVEICDDGKGFAENLLEPDEDGVKTIFKESVSTKEGEHHSGYGCYLAREISRRCGWQIDARNRPNGGACFIIHVTLG